MDLLAKAKGALSNSRASRHQDMSEVDVDAGTYRFNCSGFIGWLLRDSLPIYFTFWPKSGERPYVKDYCETIESLKVNPSPYWEVISSVWDIQPGDLVTWKRPASYGDRYPSGHVMIAADKVYPSHREGEVLLTVIDSTKMPHTDDSRERGGKTGLGYGVVGIGISEDGTPCSYFWRGGLSTNEIKTWVGMARIKCPTKVAEN